MKKSKNFVTNIGNFLLIICLVAFLQLGCDWKKFSNSGGQTNSNTEIKKEISENSKTEIPGNCKNSYYPVGQNIERKYHITYTKNSFPAQDYTETFADFKSDGFVVKTEFNNVNTAINWRCIPDGLLATQYNNSINMKSGSSAKIETVKSEGVSIPVESRWNVGEKWNTKYEINESVTDPKGNQVGEGYGTVIQNAEIIGNEEITTSAGTFQTSKVKTKIMLDLTVKVKGISVPTKTSLDSITWFAKDVGMVKSQSSMNGTEMATVELLSYKK